MAVRYGLIGTGMMGQEHARNIALIDGTQITAYADTSEQMRSAAAAALPETARGFADYRELLSADLCDAYVIAGPNDLHHGMLLDVMPTNKPVLCEKPLCTTSDACNDVMARANGAPVWVAMEYRFMPPTSRLLDLVDEGRVGRPRMVAIREHRFPFLEKVDNWNRFSQRSGGTLVEKCCHFWDLMRLITRSDPVRVFASGAMDINHLDERYDGRTPDMIDNAYTVVEFQNGARGMLDLCMFAEGSDWQELLTVTGAEGRVEARIPGPARFEPDGKLRDSEVGITDRAARAETVETVGLSEELRVAGDHYGSTYYQHLKFNELVRGNRAAPEVTLQDGAWAVRIGEAAEESARTGQAITLG